LLVEATRRSRVINAWTLNPWCRKAPGVFLLLPREAMMQIGVGVGAGQGIARASAPR